MSQHETENKVINHNFKVKNDDVSQLRVYSIYDSKLKKFLPPFYCTSDDEAIRQFSNIVNFSGSLISRFPEDYSLHFLCSFFDEVGAFNICDSKLIKNGVDLVTQTTKNYSNILGQIEKQQQTVDGLIDDYHRLLKRYPIKDEGPQLYEAKKPITQKQKKSIINKLFSH